MLFVGDILTTGYDAIRKTDMRPGDFVAVIGCGPVGLCTMMAAQALGAGTVLAVDMVPERLKLAESLGAVTVNPKEVDPADVVLDSTDWRGADLVVDAVGHESALAAAFPLVRMGGSISMPGMYVEDTAQMPIGEMWLKNITLFAGVGQRAGAHGRGDRADPPRPARPEGHHLAPAAAFGGGEGIRAVRSERRRSRSCSDPSA